MSPPDPSPAVLCGTAPNCIKFSTCQIENLMQFGVEEFGTGEHGPTLMDLGARVVRRNR